MPVFLSRKQAVTYIGGVLTIIAGLVSAVVVSWWNQPSTQQAIQKALTCQNVSQILRQYVSQSGARYDVVKCKSITQVDATHYIAVVALSLAGTTSDWKVTLSTNGIQVSAASPSPTAAQSA